MNQTTHGKHEKSSSNLHMNEIHLSPSVPYKELCRVCLRKGILCSLLCPVLNERFSIITGIKVSPNDSSPKNICNLCVDELNRTFKFLYAAKEADKIFKNAASIRNNTEPKNKKHKKSSESFSNCQIKKDNGFTNGIKITSSEIIPLTISKVLNMETVQTLKKNLEDLLSSNTISDSSEKITGWKTTDIDTYCNNKSEDLNNRIKYEVDVKQEADVLEIALEKILNDCDNKESLILEEEVDSLSFFHNLELEKERNPDSENSVIKEEDQFEYKVVVVDDDEASSEIGVEYIKIEIIQDDGIGDDLWHNTSASSDVNVVPCQYCGFSSGFQHLPKDVDESESKFPCKICVLKFENLSDLKCHLERDHPKTIFNCNNCKK